MVQVLWSFTVGDFDRCSNTVWRCWAVQPLLSTPPQPEADQTGQLSWTDVRIKKALLCTLLRENDLPKKVVIIAWNIKTKLQCWFGCHDHSVECNPRHEKKGTNDIVFKNEVLLPPESYCLGKHSAEILQLYLSILQTYATFYYRRIMYRVLTGINLTGDHAKRCGCH